MPISFSFLDIIDILIVGYLVYRLILLIRGTRAVQLLKGVAVLLLATFISEWRGLSTLSWILDKTMTAGLVAIPVIFQPELRRALEQIGRGKFFARSMVVLGEEDIVRVLDELAQAVQLMAKKRIGALIVLEREIGLNDYIETGTKIDGVVSAQMLLNLFYTGSPLHDGAVIIRGDRVAAAGCFLPLTENPNLSKEIGTRHRAALGISEQADTICVVVSEETGVISLAREGRLTRYLDAKTLKEMLMKLWHPKPRLLFRVNRGEVND
jgi:diadenylate cyclase